MADGGWPRAYATGSGANVVLDRPQILSWVDQKHITGYAAVSHTAKAATKLALGIIKIEADTSVAVTERLVNTVVLQGAMVESADSRSQRSAAS